MTRPVSVVVMGVSGCGKTTLARALADHLGWPFIEGDDHHSPENRRKMAAGIPLGNADREGWIAALTVAMKAAGPASVVACSALNPTVRRWIETGVGEAPVYVLLHGTPAMVTERLNRRTGHFMNPNLLTSQYEALDPPANAVIVPVALSPEEQLAIAAEAIRLRTAD